MVVGFNHNFRYKGAVYHIQTEDSGVKNPHIVTLLYVGGTILASKKTSYADIAKVDNLEQVVEELMKEQHKEMLRSLKAGEFDAVIERFESGRKPASPVAAAGAPPAAAVAPTPPAPPAETRPPVTPVATPPAAAPPPKPQPAPEAAAKTVPPAPAPAPASAPATAPAPKTPPSAIELSLDEVILSYLMGDDK